MAHKLSRGPSKAFYISTINVILPVNLFCGLFSWFTQFLLPCTATRLHVLMALTSQIFLANTLAIFLIFLLLFALRDTDPVDGWRNRIIQWQFAITAFSMAIAFMFLAICIPIGFVDGGDSTVGILGALIFGLLIFGAIFIGFSTAISGNAVPLADNTVNVGDVPELHWLQFAPILIVLGLEAILIIVLLAVGGHEVGVTPIYTPCSTPEMVTWATSEKPIPVFVENSTPTTTLSTVTQTITANQSVSLSRNSQTPSNTGTVTKNITTTAKPAVVTVMESEFVTVKNTISSTITIN